MNSDYVPQVPPQVVNVESGNGIYHFLFLAILLVITPLYLINWTVDVLLVVFVLGAFWRAADIVLSCLELVPCISDEDERALYLAKKRYARVSNKMKEKAPSSILLPGVNDVQQRQCGIPETKDDPDDDEVHTIEKFLLLPSRVCTESDDMIRPNDLLNQSPMEEEILPERPLQTPPFITTSNAPTFSSPHTLFAEDLMESSSNNGINTRAQMRRVQTDTINPVALPSSSLSPSIRESSEETGTSVSLVSGVLPPTPKGLDTDEDLPRQRRIGHVWNRAFHRMKDARSLLVRSKNRRKDDVQGHS